MTICFVYLNVVANYFIDRSSLFSSSLTMYRYIDDNICKHIKHSIVKGYVNTCIQVQTKHCKKAEKPKKLWMSQKSKNKRCIKWWDNNPYKRLKQRLVKSNYAQHVKIWTERKIARYIHSKTKGRQIDNPILIGGTACHQTLSSATKKP